MKAVNMVLVVVVASLLSVPAFGATRSLSGFKFWLPDQWVSSTTGDAITAASGKEVVAYFVTARSLESAEQKAVKALSPMLLSSQWGEPNNITLNGMEALSMKGSGVIAGNQIPVSLSAIAVQHAGKVFVACFAVNRAAKEKASATMRQITDSIKY